MKRNVAVDVCPLGDSWAISVVALLTMQASRKRFLSSLCPLCVLSGHKEVIPMTRVKLDGQILATPAIASADFAMSVDPANHRQDQSNFSAEIGFSGATVVNVVTRSGTNAVPRRARA